MTAQGKVTTDVGELDSNRRRLPLARDRGDVMTAVVKPAPQWTPARRAALDVFRGRSHGVRVSNVTDAAAGYIYWQTARWLVEQGFATRRVGLTADWLDLTDAGSAALYPDGGQR